MNCDIDCLEYCLKFCVLFPKTEEDRNLPTSYKLAGELLGLAAGISYAKSASKRAPSYGLNGSGKPYGKPPGKSGYTHVSSPAAQYGMHNPRTEEDRAQGMALAVGLGYFMSDFQKHQSHGFNGNEKLPEKSGIKLVSSPAAQYGIHNEGK